MTLEILIAQYKEPEEVIKSMLDSIAIQQNIDFNDINVIIANDGSDVILSKEFLKQYRYNIDYYIKDHGGLSHTRNFLLDKATGDYIMFCDADDMFWNCTALHTVLKKISERKFDCLFPYIMIEKQDSENRSFYYPNFNDQYDVHGKVLKRQFLIDNQIKWSNKLKIHDARYFFTLCKVFSDNIICYNNPYYLYKFNKNSLMNSAENWTLDTFDYFILSIDVLVEELLKRKQNYPAATVYTSFVFLNYFLYNTVEWYENKNEVEKILKIFYNFYNKYKFLLATLDTEKTLNIFKEANGEVYSKYSSKKRLEFNEWIKYLEQFK